MQEWISLVQFIIALSIRELLLMEKSRAVSTAALYSSAREKSQSKYFVQPFEE